MDRNRLLASLVSIGLCAFFAATSVIADSGAAETPLHFLCNGTLSIEPCDCARLKQDGAAAAELSNVLQIPYTFVVVPKRTISAGETIDNSNTEFVLTPKSEVQASIFQSHRITGIKSIATSGLDAGIPLSEKQLTPSPGTAFLHFGPMDPCYYRPISISKFDSLLVNDGKAKVHAQCGEKSVRVGPERLLFSPGELPGTSNACLTLDEYTALARAECACKLKVRTADDKDVIPLTLDELLPRLGDNSFSWIEQDYYERAAEASDLPRLLELMNNKNVRVARFGICSIRNLPSLGADVCKTLVDKFGTKEMAPLEDCLIFALGKCALDNAAFEKVVTSIDSLQRDSKYWLVSFFLPNITGSDKNPNQEHDIRECELRAEGIEKLQATKDPLILEAIGRELSRESAITKCIAQRLRDQANPDDPEMLLATVSGLPVEKKWDVLAHVFKIGKKAARATALQGLGEIAEQTRKPPPFHFNRQAIDGAIPQYTSVPGPYDGRFAEILLSASSDRSRVVRSTAAGFIARHPSIRQDEKLLGAFAKLIEDERSVVINVVAASLRSSFLSSGTIQEALHRTLEKTIPDRTIPFLGSDEVCNFIRTQYPELIQRLSSHEDGQLSSAANDCMKRTIPLLFLGDNE